jgi:hypothetical protein
MVGVVTCRGGGWGHGGLYSRVSRGRGGPNGPFGPSRVCHALKNDPRQGSFLKNNLLQIHLIS